MPAGILFSVLGWFASHLILLTLAGFVAVGIWIFDVQRWPDSATTTVIPTDAAAGRAADGVTVERVPHAPEKEAAPAARDELEKPATVSDAGPAFRQPVMIGGSIPVYDLKARTPPADAAFRPGEAEDGQNAAVAALPQQPNTAGEHSREASLQRARRAFWDGEFEAAEAAYMDLVAVYPEDADLFGELGNLYEAMGQEALALDAYYEAGVRLKRGDFREKLDKVIEIFEKKGDDRYRDLSVD
ncbi:MAG: hypothetical protein KDE45_14685 [Caldilineaceae bacterium]|nr:hypothetical protein [Caldilineaceae bacterium]